MKKRLIFGAMIGAIALSSCVDTTESDSVAAVRNSKAKEQEALANLYNAEAEAAKKQAETEAALAAAQAAYQQAEAAKKEAEAAQIMADAKYREAETQLKLAEVEYQKAVTELKLAEVEHQKAQTALLLAEVEYQNIMNEFQKNANDENLKILAAQAEAALAEAKIAEAEAAIAEARAKAAAAQAEAEIAEAEAAIAAAQAAKEAAENAKKQAELDLLRIEQEMEAAVLEHQIYLIELQRKLVQAQQDLMEQQNALEAAEIEQYQYYANKYLNTLNTVYGYEDDLASAKLSLQKLQLKGYEEYLSRYSVENKLSTIKMYEGYIEDNEKQIEENKKTIASKQAVLDIILNSQSFQDRDLEAFKLEVTAKEWEYKDAQAAWIEKNEDKTAAYDEAIDDAIIGLNNDAGIAAKKAYIEKYSKLTEDEYYQFINQNLRVVVTDEEDNNHYYDYNYWGNLNNLNWGYTDSKYFGDTVVYEGTYVDQYQVTQTVAARLGNNPYYNYNSIQYVPYIWPASFNESYLTPDLIKLYVANYKNDYKSSQAGYNFVADIFKKNAQEYAKRYEQLLVIQNSLETLGGSYTDSIIWAYKYVYKNGWGVDSIYYKKATVGEHVDVYTLENLSSTFLPDIIRSKNIALSNETSYRNSAKEYDYRTEALDKYVDFMTNGETYLAKFEEKCEEVKADIIAYLKPLAKAQVEKKIYSYTLQQDPEYVALQQLQTEYNEMNNLYNELNNGWNTDFNTVSYLRNEIKWAEESIESLTEQNVDYAERIEKLNSEIELGEEQAKLDYASDVAIKERQVVKYETYISYWQQIVDFYKAIVDALLAPAE